MKYFSFFSLLLVVILTSCHSSGTMSSENALKINKAAAAVNNYKIIVSEERIAPYSIIDRKRLKGLTLEEAKDKVLQEAVIARGCAMIVEPNYSYDMKGKKVTRITVVGYPGYYDFAKDSLKTK